MKVLHLPTNIASMPAITVKALNQAGHEAKGLILDSTIMQSSDGMEVYNFKKGSLTKYVTIAKWYARFYELAKWADVIHWCGSFSNPLLSITLPVIKRLHKPAVVEFVGSDIRNPEIEFADNPYYKAVFNNGYEYPYESAENSKSTQLKFARAGFDVIAMPGMGQYIDKNIFPNPYKVFQRIDTSKFEFSPPKSENKRPLIVHAPTAPVGKGTIYIEKAIENLRKNHNFDFVLIKNMKHNEALENIKKCDLYIDQLISGNYGMAAMEAMAFGKPVISFMKDSVLINEFPNDCPIINANPSNIESVIQTILSNKSILIETGVKSRNYILKYHEINNVIPILLDTYSNIIRENK
ncbi:MAG: glycosyltransferase [Bacteroidia bacterium]|nr:glycosyltransferase [Bacteroidia bacterium]